MVTMMMLFMSTMMLICRALTAIRVVAWEERLSSELTDYHKIHGRALQCSSKLRRKLQVGQWVSQQGINTSCTKGKKSSMTPLRIKGSW
jgi:hypothetical protein